MSKILLARQKLLYFFHIIFCLNDKAHMSSGRTQNLGIQLLKQSGQPCLVFFFENIIFRDKNLDLSMQIRKIRRIKYRIVFQQGDTLHTVDITLLIAQVRSHCLIKRSAVCLTFR